MNEDKDDNENIILQQHDNIENMVLWDKMTMTSLDTTLHLIWLWIISRQTYLRFCKGDCYFSAPLEKQLYRLREGGKAYTEMYSNLFTHNLVSSRLPIINVRGYFTLNVYAWSQSNISELKVLLLILFYCKVIRIYNHNDTL